MTRKQMFEQERAVSPVIGVILMVAITVILAAVIGAFVLGLGQDISSSQSPTLSTSVSHNSGYDDTDTTNALDAFYIAHSAGDTIEESDLKVVIRNEDGAEVASFSEGSWSGDTNDVAGSSGHTNPAALSIGGTAGGDFGSGDTITIADDSANPAFDNGHEFTIQIVHLPSGATVSEGTTNL